MGTVAQRQRALEAEQQRVLDTMAQDLTDEQLRKAWEARRRLGWPHDFESSMAHPVLGRIIRMHALHTPVVNRYGTEVRSPMAPERRNWIPPTPKHPPMQDQKTKASGEKEDDRFD